jgi:hypothetical protein
MASPGVAVRDDWLTKRTGRAITTGFPLPRTENLKDGMPGGYQPIERCPDAHPAEQAEEEAIERGLYECPSFLMA